MKARVTTISRTMVCAVLGVMLLAMLTPAVVLAHARYQRSEPGAGAIVSQPPARVDIWFTQELFRREGEYGIEVTGPDGSPAHLGEAVIEDDDRTHMWVGLQDSLDEGQYLVEWWNVSAEDGDDDEGSFNFRYDPAAEVTSSPMPGPSETPAPEPTSTAGDAGDQGGGPQGVECLPGLIPVLSIVLLAGARAVHRRL